MTEEEGMSSKEAEPAATAGSGAANASRILNINVGVLGHVDSGKTTLTKAISTHLSTAALDKTPQSQARGITLDLGFSAFFIEPPKHLAASYDRIQFTLVDCPGHASLIKTIIGGAQIIDLMLLVIDVTKGIQTQTAECLVIGEILTDRMIVVLNKTDLLSPPGTDAAAAAEKLNRVKNKLRKVFETTKFGASESGGWPYHHTLLLQAYEWLCDEQMFRWYQLQPIRVVRTY